MENIVTIRDYIDTRIEAIQLNASQRFDAQQLALKDALIAQEKGTSLALVNTEKAIDKAAANTDKRFDELSEKITVATTSIDRTSGIQGIYVTHTDLSAEMEKLRLGFENMLRPVITFMNNSQGQSKGLNAGWIYLIGAIGLIGTVLGIVLAISK